MALRSGGAGKPSPVRVREGIRLSPNEERYVLAETLTGQVYTVPSATRVKGPIPFETAAAALQATCDAHEARRTGFERGADGTFTKYIHDRATVELKQITMLGASDEEILAAVNAYGMRKGDFSPGELHRFLLIKLGENDHVFSMALHHATSDGITAQAFGMEFYARILGFPVAEKQTQYSDVWDFDWQQSEAYKKAEAFWLDRVKGVEEVVAWPADVAGEGRVPVRPGEAVVIPPESLARTQAAAARIGVTHFSFFYAAYLVLLSRMTGSQTICTTFQSAGRKAFPQAGAAQGVFSNALMLASRVDESESIAALARRLRGEVREAIAHEIYPFHHLIRATGLHPRYAINWFPEGKPVHFADIELIQMKVEQNQDDDDLNFRFITYGDVVKLVFFYNPSLFGSDRVTAAARQLAALANALARDVDQPIADTRSADLAPAGLLPDLAALLPGSGQETIFARFLDRAAEAPDAIALVYGETRLTYAELEARSRGLAGALRGHGLMAGDRVAILAERGPELVWSMLACARAGLTFVVLDSAYAEPRLTDFVAIAAPQAVVRAGPATLSALAGRLALERRLPVLDAQATAENPPDLDVVDPDSPAYILFTSGSTGRPKGVACSHQPLADFVAWQSETFGLTAADRFTLLSGLSHDPVLRDVFTPLSLGATLLIPPVEVGAEPGGLAAWLRQAGATVAHITPQLGRLITAAAGGTAPLTALRRVFWGGDRLAREQVEALARLAPGVRQTSFYGATETPQAVAAQEVDAGMTRAFAPLGHGVAGAQLLVVDAEGRPLGIGELGEVAVRSNRLALGYVDGGRIVRPADRLADPAGYLNIHRTGDRGLYLPDGSVMFAGRTDDQVKVHGHRVHLSEIVAALLARPGVREAIAVPVGEGDDLMIAAFVTGSAAACREAELQAALRARLPGHMVPRRITGVERFPLSPNGKVDRAALVARLAEPAAPAGPAAAPPNRGERALIEAWSSVMPGAVLTRNSTFAAAGGDSLSYVQAYLAGEALLGALPEGWPLMSVADLVAAHAPARTKRVHIEMPLVMRAATIFLIVSAHLGLLRYGGGATSALFMVSGFMFGSMALQEVFSTRSAAPALRVLRNLFVPTAILSLGIWAFRSFGHSPSPYILLFTADLQDYSRSNAQDLPLWFIHSLLHILVALYLAALGLQVSRRFDTGPRAFLLALFAVACVGRFVLPLLLDPQFFTPDAGRQDRVYFLPTTHLATVVLGALIANSAGDRERRASLALLVPYALASAVFFGPVSAAFILGGGLLLLFVPRVAAPRFVAPVLFSIAGASLWIYLTHMELRDGLAHLGVALPPILAVPVALAFGVLVWKLWGQARDFGGRMIGKPMPAPSDSTI